LDIVMPRINGYDCFCELRKINGAIKALIMSGYAISGEAQRIIDAGASKFIHKPFTMDVLAQAIHEVLRKAD
jgi:two-component system, cell cycle sensor histidine kinase and response regulator CckA